MGAKTTMLALVDGDAVAILKSAPQLDREACLATVRQLFPGKRFDPLPDGDLSDTYPRNGELYVGCFPGLTILAHDSLVAEPSQLDRRFLDFANGRTMIQHVMISTVDGFAYGIWEKGELRRSLVIDADNGTTEDIGARRPFEEPFWAGEHRVEDEDEERDENYAGGAPFHPLELAEAALLDLFGYQLEGVIGPDEVRPETIPMMHFALAAAKPWWKFW
jgi:hypothetical protein